MDRIEHRVGASDVYRLSFGEVNLGVGLAVVNEVMMAGSSGVIAIPFRNALSPIE